MPMMPVPGSPQWMWEAYCRELLRLRDRAIGLRWAALLCGVAFLFTLLFCVIIFS